MITNLLPIACFAPSGKAIDLVAVDRGYKHLREQGFQLHNTECTQRAFQRFAGTDTERLHEINHLPELIATIGPCIALAIRGGYGISRLLPRIDWDRLAIAVDKGLMIIGHSDLTALQIALLAKTGRKSYSGPMLSYDFGCESNDISSFTMQSFHQAIQLQPLQTTVDAKQLYLDSRQFDCEGLLWGGNLSIISNLLGTSYFPDKSIIKNGILVIEDVNEHPYRIERMLLQLLQAGILETQQAIVFGDFSSYQLSEHDAGYDLHSSIALLKSELLRMGAKTQVLHQLPFGHCRDKITLPIGVTGRVNAHQNGFILTSI